MSDNDVPARGSPRQDLRWPVSGRIRSLGRTPADPVAQMTVRQHSGLDIEVSPGTAVVAAGAGRVTRAGAYGGYGNCVDITHGKNCVTRYAQLSKVLTSVGATVSVGQKIGLAGRTGRSTVPHLHVDVYVDGADAIASREAPSEGQWVSVGTALPLDVHDLDAATGRS